MKKPLEALLEFLDARVLQPTVSSDPLRYGSSEYRKVLKRVQRRVHDTRVLTRFENIRQEFLALCKNLGV